MLDEKNVRELIKRDFPFLQKCHYFDSASVCPAPRQTVEAMSSYYYEHPLNYGVGEFRMAQEVIRKVDEARATVAAFVGASANEIVFTKNTTEAINTVSRGWVWKEGDGILLTTLEHQSNIIPWLRAAKKFNLNVYYLTNGDDGQISPRDLEKLLNEHRVRMVAVTHVSNILGTIQDVATLVKIAKQRGALTLVDAAQSAGRVAIDVKSIGCDFATFCGRKALMGPQGTGFLYGLEDRLRELMPLSTGSRAADIKNQKDYQDQAPPHRFEAGVLNTAGFIGLGRSVQYIQELDSKAVTQRIRNLSRMLLKSLLEMKGVVVHSPKEVGAQAGIISWNIPDVVPKSVSEWLDKEANVAVATGHQGSRLVTQSLSPNGVVRTSVHWFNTSDDVQAFAGGLERFLSSQRRNR